MNITRLYKKFVSRLARRKEGDLQSALDEADDDDMNDPFAADRRREEKERNEYLDFIGYPRELRD